MSGSQPPAPPKMGGGGLSLYANLLDAKAGDSSKPAGSISRVPMVFKRAGESGGDEPATAKKPLDPATLRFQPIRRPQLAAQKQKPKTAAAPPAAPANLPNNAAKPMSTAAPPVPPTAAASSASIAMAPDVPIITTTSSSPVAAAPPPPPTQGRSKLADWAATEEDEYVYGTGDKKRQRGGRRQKKKKGRGGDGKSHGAETNWDELYDPDRPTNVEEYLRSDERIAEIREWKAVLYAHRRSRTRRRSSTGSIGSDDYDGERGAHHDGRADQFGPPSYSFAPPPESPPRASPQEGPMPAAALPDDATGDDAYARRMALSGVASGGSAAAATPSPALTPPAPKADDGDPPFAGAVISRAAVRYDQQPSQRQGPTSDDEMDTDEDEEDHDKSAIGEATAGAMDDQQPQPRSNRPGQAGFAERMMTKMGWQKGSGLGADGSGIVTGLSVKVEKRRRRPDSEGGGFAEPVGRGRIVGGKRSNNAGGDNGGEGKFGRMSEVVLLRGMLEGMEDLAGEVAGGLAQEIGEECGEKYGRVERLYIDVENRQVFIKFTDQVSALRAVNALEGRVFNGNTIMPSFYNVDKFEKGVYL